MSYPPPGGGLTGIFKVTDWPEAPDPPPGSVKVGAAGVRKKFWPIFWHFPFFFAIFCPFFRVIGRRVGLAVPPPPGEGVTG